MIVGDQVTDPGRCDQQFSEDDSDERGGRTEAQARGYGQVRLDVIDTNWRAKALYERLGFKVLKTDQLGLLRYIFGFASSSTMVKDLAP